MSETAQRMLTGSLGKLDLVPGQAGAATAGPNERRRRAARRRRAGSRMVLVLSDLGAIGLSELLGWRLLRVRTAQGSSAIVHGWLVAVLLACFVLAAIAANGVYTNWARQLLTSSFNEVRDLVYALGVAGCATVGTAHFAGLARLDSFSPLTVVASLVVAAVLVPLLRTVVRWGLRASPSRQWRILVLGSGMMARIVVRSLAWDRAIAVLGCVDDQPLDGDTVLGTLDDLPRLCQELDVDQVVVGFSRSHPSRVLEPLRQIDPSVTVSVVPRYFELLSTRSRLDELAGLPLVEAAAADPSALGRRLKRWMDILCSGFLLLLAAPVLLLFAATIKATSRGPVFFRQERIGYGERPFVMYKFRTMVDDPCHATDLTGLSSEFDGPLFKMRNDPRVTNVGRWLRRTSLDELPQLLNVLLGDMSLVGPRPFVASESAQLLGPARRRFEVRPGMTGLWQISGRSHLSYEELVRLDYLYVASWSLWFDLRILWHTPARVLKGHGAF